MVPLNKIKCYSLVETDTKRLEKFSERDTGINITNDNDISSLIKIANDVLDLDSALHFWHEKDKYIFKRYT